MKTFKELRGELEEHPNLRTRIVKAINPMDKLRDKMDDLKKKLPGAIKDKAINKLKDKIDAINPLSPLHAVGNAQINKNISKLRDKKKALTDKAKKSGMPYGILKKVYDRGMAAYKTGHRPGTTAQQWAFARVNSFVTKSKGTWSGADKDLAAKVRG